ncbi:hypothetical protein GKD08_15470, partial [Paeniclostridium sordellii]|nr:hypothetical protein [Paeniclostridium sordellii]
MTTLELVIGIGLILIIIYISFPKLESNKYELDSFARQLVADIRYVRNMNINGNKDCYI